MNNLLARAIIIILAALNFIYIDNTFNAVIFGGLVVLFFFC